MELWRPLYASYNTLLLDAWHRNIELQKMIAWMGQRLLIVWHSWNSWKTLFDCSSMQKLSRCSRFFIPVVVVLTLFALHHWPFSRQQLHWCRVCAGSQPNWLFQLMQERCLYQRCWIEGRAFQVSMALRRSSSSYTTLPNFDTDSGETTLFVAPSNWRIDTYFVGNNTILLNPSSLSTSPDITSCTDTPPPIAALY